VYDHMTSVHFFTVNMQSIYFKSTVWTTYRKAYGI